MINHDQLEFLARACKSLVNKYALQQAAVETAETRRIQALSIAYSITSKAPAKDVKKAIRAIRDILEGDDESLSL